MRRRGSSSQRTVLDSRGQDPARSIRQTCTVDWPRMEKSYSVGLSRGDGSLLKRQGRFILRAGPAVACEICRDAAEGIVLPVAGEKVLGSDFRFRGRAKQYSSLPIASNS